ncbi:hypothetical protein CH54_1395 [Yersinia rochesterensis]|uniref:Uncharacterized protein n=1 Tax=Yersinia rochesterensis TaxID=1604335 RepID=A0ABN4FEJ2_9GAMM|nr:hypothetical protein [Yersinia rochesterensis]AIN20188.1 hypothetical protein DJ57_2242 [Yersinia rochesterensis]AJI88680.1 hypothetical protein AW19_269 [Yersinia frederiksenii Y225]AJJ35611.1 hypothetical protein CH54_1395 [Yersinia rochesterensis]
MKNKQRQAYSYPTNDMYSSEVHTVKGVRGLVSGSNIERLLMELEADGHDISAPMIELKSLLNYVAHDGRLRGDLLAHAEYILEKLREGE